MTDIGHLRYLLLSVISYHRLTRKRVYTCILGWSLFAVNLGLPQCLEKMVRLLAEMAFNKLIPGQKQ